MKKAAELVFIPATGISHLVPTVEFVKALIDSENRLSVTILNINDPSHPIPPAYTQSITSTKYGDSIRFIDLLISPPDPTPLQMKFSSILEGLCEFIECYKLPAKRAISQLIIESTANSVPLAALVVDMFATTMIDIANEFGLPSYTYYTSGAATLGLMLHLPTLDSQITADVIDYPGELEIPSFKNPVPPAAVPSVIWTRNGDYKWYLYHARKFHETKGIIVNSFHDLEPYAFDSFKGRSPRVYSVGPLIDFTGRTHSDRAEDSNKIMKWLDNQEPSSVVFLCFGSAGAFDPPQVKEIALGLERSGHRFLWALRVRPGSSNTNGSTKLDEKEEVLPEGFLERTAERGLVCEWVPQVSVLAHEAVGCFVSHCGWNSTLESLWFGVPILTWPLYAEQRLNAFQLVRELGLAVQLRGYDIKADEELTMADEVERGVRILMEDEMSEVRKKVKEMKLECRKAVVESGSSVSSVKRFLDDLLGGVCR